MPDITMCKNETCPLNQKCYRYRAVPSEYGQTFALFYPIYDEQENVIDCEYLMPIPKNKQKD